MEDKLQEQIDKFVAWKEHPCAVLSRNGNDVIMSTPIQSVVGTVPVIIRVCESSAMPQLYYVEVSAFDGMWHSYRMERTDIKSVDDAFNKVKRHFARKEKDAKEAVERQRRRLNNSAREAKFKKDMFAVGKYYILETARKYYSPEWDSDKDPIDEAELVSFQIRAERDNGDMNGDECRFVIGLVDTAVRLAQFAMPDGIKIELVRW